MKTDRRQTGAAKRKRRKHQALHLLLADDQGRFYDHPELLAAGRTWDRTGPWADPRLHMAEPDGLQMVFLPGRRPVGIDPDSGQALAVTEFEIDGRRFTPHAVAALLPPGHLRQLLPAAITEPEAPVLPLRAWCAVALQGERLRVAAQRIDTHTHWDPARFADPALEGSIDSLLSRFAKNPVLKQLARCAREYYCCTARNVFLGTFEGALPVSDRCNARCMGCISEQAGQTISPQTRLTQVPEPEAIAEVAIHHLKRADPAMVSFGQGCEGEPLLQAELIGAAIKAIRQGTDRGTIHMNTNGSRPEALEGLARAGLQSVRVSLLSARPEAFDAYHRSDFDLAQVEAFVRLAVEIGLFVSLNLLTFPGFTDRPGELAALTALLDRTGAHMIQLRNLDLDPDRLVESVEPGEGSPLGLPDYLKALAREVPYLQLGSFNPFPADWGPRFQNP